MSFLNKLQTRLQEVREKALSAVELVEEPIRNNRLDICNTCEHLYTPTRNCKLCGCFVDAKTYVANTKCPINKW